MKRTLLVSMSLLLGGWLLGTLILGGVASENFFLIDRLLNSSPHPAFLRDVRQLPPGEARVLLRYLSSELNRYYFEVWGWIEAVLDIVLLLLAARAKQTKLVVGFVLMLLLVALMNFYLTPQIIMVGRALDFVPREPPPPQLATFGWLHGAYSILDLVKVGIGVCTAITLGRSER